jgi:hypothetical protein
MADVTISGLTRGIPTGNNIIPYSTGSDTLGVPVSALFHNAGNIGIGTPDPQKAIEVRGDGTLGAGRIRVSNSTDPAYEISDTTNVKGYLFYDTIGASNSIILRHASVFNQLVLKNTGNVGIGTTTPAEKLTVVGNISASGDVISPSVPKFAYAVLSQVGTAPYTVTTLASAHVESITVNPTTADITINWTTNYFNDANYCITFGAQSQFVGNRSQGINIQTGSTKTRNSVTIMAGSVSNGQFYAVPNINVMAIQ